MDTIDLVFSYDTTGSMSPAITQTRRHIKQTVDYLFTQIPNIRIGIISHGDYCDGPNWLSLLDLTTDKSKIINFINKAPSTGGGDADEAYEAVLNRARSLFWTARNNKALVLIGDANPHAVGYRYGNHTNRFNWRNEAKLLVETGVQIYPVQALGRSGSNGFYEELANISGTQKLELEQFQDVTNTILAICMSRADKLNEFADELESRHASPVIYDIVTILSGKKVKPKKKTENSKHAVHPSRFQILEVDSDIPIKDFVKANGLTFKTGRGFYEFTKLVKIQDYKEVVIQDKKTGEMFNGDKAREILGIPIGLTSKVKPEKLTQYRGFIQSTSNNRKLLSGTKFLYEVTDYERHS